MDIQVGQTSPCYGVRRLYFPQTANIVIVVLAALVILINSLAMISVLKNYRRLRQRIYVFVISLAATNILAGVIFFTDVMIRFFIEKHHQNGNVDKDDVIFSSEEKYIKLKVNEDNILSQEFLETFKASVVVLSVLNTGLVTFALYKRTASMGRHHEDFRNVNGALGPDGHSFLPAFDTMMRVLSIGSPAAANGYNGKNMGKGAGHMMRNGDYSPSRRISTSSRLSSSPQRKSSFSREQDSVLLEKYQDEQNSGSRKPHIVRVSIDNTTRKPSHYSEKQTKRSGSVGRLMNTGRRVSHAIRSRSLSGNQSYVGRHSYSVMSKSATGWSLTCIWVIFVVTCILPLVLRRAGISSGVCPEACRNVDILEMTKTFVIKEKEQNQTKDSNSIYGDLKNRKSVSRSTSLSINLTSNVNHGPSVIDQNHDNLEEEISELLTVNVSRQDSNTSSTNNRIRGNLFYDSSVIFVASMNVGDCAPVNFYPNSKKRSFDSGMLVGRFQTMKPDSGESHKIKRAPSTPRCSSCSAAFFPLSKSHMFFIAIVTFLTWCWLIISASRLLYLRKHSSNVFVRCSALWRFMFMTAFFFFFTLAPYTTWIILDFVTASPVTKSPLWYNKSNANKNAYAGPVMNEALFSSNTSYYETNHEDIYYLYPLYGVCATCLVLINFAVAPTMYLVRLLGFRRIISAL